jgi:hypothetical protein
MPKPAFRCLLGLLLAACALCDPGTARAWTPDGHRTIGAIADKLLQGTRAANEVRTILGGVSLADAAVWADCAKGVDPSTLEYRGSAAHPECAPFETPTGKAAMVDFVQRNATGCHPKPDEEICHKQYHYADVSVQHHDYQPSYVGARDDDVVHAAAAAIAVLQGGAAPAPFSIKDKREALLVLAHYVGDMHQPLHIGAVYLDAAGKIVNPEAGGHDPATETRGGNRITIKGSAANLHATWDAIPPPFFADSVNEKWLDQARAIAPTPGPVTGWPAAWATDTQKQADKALAVLKFGARSEQNQTWSTKLSSAYAASMTAAKRAQLTKAGARLAQLLQKIWPAD